MNGPTGSTRVRPGGRTLRLVSGGAPDRSCPGPDTLLHVAGSASDLMRLGPVVSALQHRGAFRQAVVHGAGHSGDKVLDRLEAQVTARQLVPLPGRRGERAAGVLLSFETVLEAERPIAVVVAGDGELAFGCALAAARTGVPVARIDAGSRSSDRTEPDEVNRVLIDRVADLLFAQDSHAAANLRREGAVDGRFQVLGNSLIDALRRDEREAGALRAWVGHGLERRAYVLVRLGHLDGADAQRVDALLEALVRLAGRTPIVLSPADAGATALALRLHADGIRVEHARSSLHDLSLLTGAGAVITDCDDVQEQASVLGIRCHTLGSRTSRPITVSHGTNALLGNDPAALADVLPSPWAPTPAMVPMWDGRAGARIADALVANYALTRSSRSLDG